MTICRLAKHRQAFTVIRNDVGFFSLFSDRNSVESLQNIKVMSGGIWSQEVYLWSFSQLNGNKGFNRNLWENLIVDVTDRQERRRRRKVKQKRMLCWSKSLSCVTFHWIYSRLPRVIGFPGGSVVKNPPVMQEMQMWVWSWVGKIPWRRKS